MRVAVRSVQEFVPAASTAFSIAPAALRIARSHMVSAGLPRLIAAFALVSARASIM